MAVATVIDGEKKIMDLMVEPIAYFFAGGLFLLYLFLTLIKKVEWKEYPTEDDHQLGAALLIFIFSLPILIIWIVDWLFF